MLSKEALKSVADISYDLVQRGFEVQPVQNTPLFKLVSESLPLQQYTNVVNAAEGTANQCCLDYAIDSVSYTANSNTPNTDIKPHNLVIDEIVPTLVEAVNNHISHAKNVVIPLVQELVKRTEAKLNSVAVSGLLGLDIIIDNPPTPFTNGIFLNSIEKYSEVNYDPNFSLPFAFNLLSSDELAKLIETNSNDLDADVEKWLAGMGEGYVGRVWNQFFMGTDSLNLHNFVKNEASKNYGDVSALMVIHLLARNLFDNPPEGCDVSLSIYNTAISTLRDITGARLAYENELYNTRCNKQKSLVLKTDDYKVTVNGRVYKEWITNGGVTESLLAAAILHPEMSTDVETIDSNKERLAAEWERHIAFINSAEQNRKFVRTTQYLDQTFRELILSSENSNYKNEMSVKTFSDELAKLHEVDFSCMYIACVKLVCRACFNDTDAEDIILSINKVSNENPKVTIREAAAIATIEYITNWVMHQIKVI